MTFSQVIFYPTMTSTLNTTDYLFGVRVCLGCFERRPTFQRPAGSAGSRGQREG